VRSSFSSDLDQSSGKHSISQALSQTVSERMMISVSPRISISVPIQQRQNNSSSSLKKNSTSAQNRLPRTLDGPSSAAPVWRVAVVPSCPSARLLDQGARMVEVVKKTDAFWPKFHQKSQTRENCFEHAFVEFDAISVENCRSAGFCSALRCLSSPFLWLSNN
jgi:hypothetical protein